MNTNLLIGLIVGGVVVVGGGYYLYTNTAATDESPAQELVAQQEENSTEPISGTFASLLGLGQRLMCTFEHSYEGSSSSGTMYIANGAKQLRGDFVVEQAGMAPMEAHMIRVDGYNYVWGSMYPQGIKIEVTEGEEQTLFNEDGGMSIDENTAFNCTPWNVDTSKFRVPSDIEFTDFSVQMDQMMQMQGSMNTDIKAQQCAACAQVPAGAAREQCLQALQCS